MPDVVAPRRGYFERTISSAVARYRTDASERLRSRAMGAYRRIMMRESRGRGSEPPDRPWHSTSH